MCDLHEYLASAALGNGRRGQGGKRLGERNGSRFSSRARRRVMKVDGVPMEAFGDRSPGQGKPDLTIG